MKRDTKLELKECANPECKKLFKPYSSKQRICGSDKCKVWMLNETKYRKAEYKFNPDYITRVVKSKGKNFNELSKIQTELHLFLDGLIFTRTDMEKI